jgi:hypothetical protein
MLHTSISTLAAEMRKRGSPARNTFRLIAQDRPSQRFSPELVFEAIVSTPLNGTPPVYSQGGGLLTPEWLTLSPSRSPDRAINAPGIPTSPIWPSGHRVQGKPRRCSYRRGIAVAFCGPLQLLAPALRYLVSAILSPASMYAAACSKASTWPSRSTSKHSAAVQPGRPQKTTGRPSGNDHLRRARMTSGCRWDSNGPRCPG